MQLEVLDKSQTYSAYKMLLKKRVHTIEFDTSKSLEEISMKLRGLVDFNLSDYKSSASITNDFYGDVLGPGKFSISIRPRIFGLWDMFARIDPKIDLEVQFNRVKIRIHDSSPIFQYIANLLVLVFIAGLFIDELPGISITEILINIGIFLGALFIINFLAVDRFKSTIKQVKKKIIHEIR